MNLPILPTPEVDLSLATPQVGSGLERLLAEVFVQVGSGPAAKYAIEYGEYLLGCDPGCQIVVEADGVSRRHARLTFNSYELILEDLESSNGVFIDGMQVQLPTRIRPDQEVQIGAAVLHIRLSEETARQFADALWDADLGLAPVKKQLIGRKYKVLTTVARGGMGVILQARDLRIRRTVAMKVMKTGSQFSPENVLRFIDEAQLTGQLEHPNIVPVYELGIDEHGETFYTMKYVKGITLGAVIQGLRKGDPEIASHYSLGALLTIFQKISDAVAYAHSRGVIHRDLKPENIMIGAYGEVLVMDWGLAKQQSEPENGEATRQPVPANNMIGASRGFETLHGVVVGTPPYVSPEQARGELDRIDERSDIYVLGAILYAILTLRAPIRGTTVEEVLESITEGKIDHPSVPAKGGGTFPPGFGDEEIVLTHCPGQRVPEGLAAVAMKALQMEPADRYQKVEEMQADIAAFQGGFPTRAERASAWRQLVLFAGRHKREVALLFIFSLVFQVGLLAFVLQANAEKNRARADEQRVRESREELAKAMEALRGTAPTYAREAASLLDDQQPEQALDKIDYALEQLPNSPEYHYLRGNILQTLLRFEDAAAAYTQVLSRNPKHRPARENLQLTKRLMAKMGDDDQPSPALLRELQAALVSQKRVGEALYVLSEIGRDRELFDKTMKTVLEELGLNQRYETKEDQTIFLDLGKMPGKTPVLHQRKLREAPISGLNLDDSKIPDISSLKAWKLQTLSLNRTPVKDLSPLIGMPLRALNLDGVQAPSLAPLSRLPLESLRISGMKIDTLAPLRGMKLEQLNASGCRNVKDVTPLAGMPLQSLDLSRTGISDLTPLIHSPIRELNLEGCVDLTDLSPLMEIKTLESVLIPSQCKDIEFLRDHPNIKRLSYKKLTQPVYEFWEEWDARHGAAH